MDKHPSPNATSSPIRDRIDPFDFASSPNKVDYVATPININNNATVSTPKTAWTVTLTPNKSLNVPKVAKTPIPPITTPHVELSAKKNGAFLQTPIQNEKENDKLNQSISKLSIKPILENINLVEEADDEIVIFSRKPSALNTPNQYEKKFST